MVKECAVWVPRAGREIDGGAVHEMEAAPRERELDLFSVNLEGTCTYFSLSGVHARSSDWPTTAR